MNQLVRYSLALIVFAGSCLNPAAAVDPGDQGPVFVDPQSLPEAFRSATIAIVDGFNGRDLDSLEKLFDFEKFGLAACEVLVSSAAKIGNCVGGVEKSRRKVLAGLVKVLEVSDGDLTLTGYVQRPLGVLSQVRFDLGDNGFDYIEFLLEEQSDGSYRVSDWYRLSSGRMASESIGIVSRVMQDPNPGIVKKLLGISGFGTDNIDIIKAISRARFRGDYVEANRLFATLSPEIRNTRVFLEMGIQLASLAQNDALYRERLGLLAKLYGDDPSAAFLLLDHYYYEGDVDKALANLEAMENKIGRDGFTTFLKGNLYFDMVKQYDTAKDYYWKAIDIEPGLDDSYYPLAYIYIVEENFVKAVEVYRLLETNFGVQYTANDFYDSPEVNLFKASTEFKQWMASR